MVFPEGARRPAISLSDTLLRMCQRRIIPGRSTSITHFPRSCYGSIVSSTWVRFGCKLTRTDASTDPISCSRVQSATNNLPFWQLFHGKLQRAILHTSSEQMTQESACRVCRCEND